MSKAIIHAMTHAIECKERARLDAAWERVALFSRADLAGEYAADQRKSDNGRTYRFRICKCGRTRVGPLGRKP